jgi:hypothetical protein
MAVQTAKPLPKWVMQRYSKLWQKCREKEFEHEQAVQVVGQKHASIILSHLKKNGWMTISLHPEDSRKRIYLLKSPAQAVEEMAK